MKEVTEWVSEWRWESEWAGKRVSRKKELRGYIGWGRLEWKSRDSQTNTSTLHTHTKRAWIVRLEGCDELKNGAYTQNGSESLPLFFLLYTLYCPCAISRRLCCLPLSLSPLPWTFLYFFSAKYSFFSIVHEIKCLPVSPSIFVHVVLIWLLIVIRECVSKPYVRSRHWLCRSGFEPPFVSLIIRRPRRI